MSNVNILTTKRDAKIADEAAEKARQVPEPTGYHILCMVPKIEETFAESVIIKADTTMHVESQTTMVLYVAKLGPMAYKDESKFPTGPWCKEGDFVLLRAYSGSRFSVDGKEFIIVNDDMIEGVVEDPRGINRAY